MRADSVKLVAGLSAADLARGGRHRVGFLTVRDLLHEWVHHDMGNAQRFSAT